MKRVLDAGLEATVVGGFSRIGFSVRKRLFDWAEYDLTGKRILITGGTSGIGYAAARDAALAGATVAITGREQVRTAKAAAEVGAVPLTCDASDLEQVARLAEQAPSALGGLDVLVNNAGALDAEYEVSPQGFERTYAVHVLAPFSLTARLLHNVECVITVSSGGMYSQGLDLDHVEMGREDYDGVTAYARAKRAQVALNAAWARRHPEGPVFAAMHPGWADTPGVAHSLPTFQKVTRPILRTAEQGADTILWLAATEVPSGRFWLDRAPRSTQRVPWLTYDRSVEDRLWERAAKQAGVRVS